MKTFATLLLLSLVPAFAVVLDTEGLPDTGLNTSSWVQGQLPPLEDIYTLNDFQLAAKTVLPKTTYAFYRTGSLNENTYHANFDIWKYLKLRPRMLQNTHNISLNTSILGHEFAAPFFLAPAALAGLAQPDGEISIAKAAGAAGILYASSGSSNKTTEEIGAAATPGVAQFRQIYPLANETMFEESVIAYHASGFKAIFLTIDNPTERGIRIRSLRAMGPDSTGTHSDTFGLTQLAALRASTSLPVIPKGIIINWEDAVVALDLGFPAIYISNHGGRLLDGAPTSVEVLLDIRKNAPQVFEKMEVYADGGTMFANVYGQKGVARMIEIFQGELKTTLQLLGITSPAQLQAKHVNAKVVQTWLE